MAKRKASCEEFESGPEVYILSSNGMTPFSGSEGFSVSSLINNFFRSLGTRFNYRYDLGSAHFLYRADELLPEEEYRRIHEASAAEDVNKLSGAKIIDFFKMMLRVETSLPISGFNITPNVGSTRDSLEVLINKIVDATHKPIALPIPNWHFWELNLDNRDSFKYFPAHNSEDLVSGFRKIAKKVSGLVLVDPANPLMYRIEEGAAREINTIAEKYGVNVIVDDVLRGTMPIGQRDSIARWFEQPYVVEGLGKRFGDDPAGEVSYIACPRNGKVQIIAEKDVPSIRDFGDMLYGDLLTLMYDHGDREIQKELENRNMSFDLGVKSCKFKVKVHRPFLSSIVSMVEVPDECGFDAEPFAKTARDKGLGIGALSEAFLPEGYKPFKQYSKKFRVTVGRHDAGELRAAGNLIAEGMEYLKGRI